MMHNDHDDAAQRDPLAALLSALDALAPREDVTASFEADLGAVAQSGGMLFAGGIKLPRRDARFAYVENNGAAASVNVYAGSGGGGRLLQTIKHGTYKVFAIPDAVQSLSLVASAMNDAGAVRVTLTTCVWSVQQGTAL